MPLTVAVQMDPLDSINIAGDSTFALMLSAQARGHRLFHYLVDALSYHQAGFGAMAHPVTVRPEQGQPLQLR
jgi:glutathione synthase